MSIDIDKEALAFERWFAAGDHNGCGIEIWLAAKRHAAQVADSHQPANSHQLDSHQPSGASNTEQHRHFTDIPQRPSGASVDSGLLPCAHCSGHAQDDFIEGESYLIECYVCGANTGPQDSAEAAVAAWNRRASVDSVARDAARFRQAIEIEDNAKALYEAVMNNTPHKDAIRAEFDAAMSPTKAGEG